MTAALPPLSSTQRVIEWDELPPRVRDIPADFDPLAAGILMAHQVEWCAIRASIKACPKGRRAGITFAEALDDTILAATSRKAGGDNVYYIGDTKEKGLEFIGYCGKFSRIIAAAQAQAISGIEEFLFDDQDEKGNTRQITSYRIRFASGFQIVALSSNPANIRGLQGKVVIDEAAFHANVQGVLDAATALLIWGGSIAVISSHNGKNNPFNQLIKDIQEGRYGDDAKVYNKATFDDAVANGLYERSMAMKGQKATPEGKRKWYEKIRNAYGPRKAAMREELDAIPRDGNGVCLPGSWIETAMQEARTVLRITLDSDFVNKSEQKRREWCEEWIRVYLQPLLDALSPELRHVLGMDFARHRDFSIIAPMAINQLRKRIVPFMVEMHNVPTRQQEQILWAIIAALPKFGGAAIDATGSGETIAEYTADKFGAHLVHQVKLSRTWYGSWAPKFIDAFEDEDIDLPKDDNIAQDLRAIEESDGIPMISKLRRKDLKDPDLQRHGDSAVALMLGWFATLNMQAGEIEYTAIPSKGAPRDEDDDDFPASTFGGAW